MQKIAGTPSVIKQANQLLILELIQKQPGITKPELARATNLSLVTVSRAVDELSLIHILCREKKRGNIGAGKMRPAFSARASFSSEWYLPARCLTGAAR